MAAVMMPTNIAGSLIGAYIYVSFPALYLQIILTIMLIILAAQSLNKGIEIYGKETKAKNAKLSKVGTDNKPDTPTSAI